MSVAHAILGLLIEGEKHGYQIATMLAERIPAGPYNSGQVHQALDRIEADGWAISRPDVGVTRARRLLSITAAGRQEFHGWLQRPLAVGRPMRDEVVIKLVFLGLHEPSRLVPLLETHRREHIRHLAQVQREGIMKSAKDRTQKLAQLARDAFRFREEAEVRWIEHCLGQLRQEAGEHIQQPNEGSSCSHDATVARGTKSK